MQGKSVRLWVLSLLAASAIPGLARGAAVEASDDGAGDSPAGGGLQEITVTAEKENQSLQKTAAAVTAISGDSLVEAGIADIRAAQMLVPAARFQQEGSTTQVFIRGIGANLDVADIQPNVAFNLNGIYEPREGTSSAFFDLADLEVLPGPQGTLYGRSAVGGTVNINFNRPSNDWSGNVLVEYGNYSLFHVTVAQNLPVTSVLSLRAAVNYTDRRGYEDSGADSENDPSERLSLLFTPTEDISAFLWSSDARKFGHPPNLVNKGTDPNTGAFSPDAFLFSNPWNDTQSRPIPGTFCCSAGYPLLGFLGPPQADKQVYENFSNGGQIDWRLGWGTLTYIPSYIYLNSGQHYGLGPISAFIAERYNMSSNELRLTGNKGGPVDWLIGVSEYHQHNTGFFATAFGVNSDVRDNLIEGEALYGQATYHVTDQFRLTAGGRYSSDKREAWGYETATMTGAPVGLFTFDRSYSHVDWKAGAEYDLTPKVMAYAVAQTGYAPGTYNTAPSTSSFDNSVRPTYLNAYTVGFKSRFEDDTLQINPEFFYYDYRDLIQQQYDANLNFNPVFNAAKSTIYGGQIDVLWQPGRFDVINLTPSYTHARNVDFVTPIGGNFDGLPLVYSPDETLVAGWTHTFPLPGGSVRAHLDLRYESRWWATYDEHPGTDQPASAKEDLTIMYESDRHWSAGIWGKNLSNEAVLAATGSGGLPGPALAFLEAPRTFGLRATFAW